MADEGWDLIKIYVWSDGTYCYEDEVEEYMHFMSDDFLELSIHGGMEEEAIQERAKEAHAI